MYPRTLIAVAFSGLLVAGAGYFFPGSAGASAFSRIVASSDVAQAEILHQQGLLQDKKGNLQVAIALYTDALELNPNSAETYTARAGVWGKLKEYDAAINDYSAAIDLDEELAPAYGGRGLALSLQGELDAGVNDLWIAAQLFREQDQVEEYFQTLSIIESIAP